jgi:putative endonuclease
VSTGERAERIAAGYLQRKGLALIETNYRCRWGEIDLVLRDRDTIVFIEVKLRRSTSFGGAAYSVTPRKRADHRRGAPLLAEERNPCRFDVVLLERLDPPRIEWIRDAFSA